MSLEAWGDEIPDQGYTEERVNEIGLANFIRGAQMFREGVARAYEKDYPETAKSIREAWNDVWGPDPGKPTDEDYIRIDEHGIDPMEVA